ncbi:hypothetical protein OMAG_000502 [Candidatus Omnitrophus magneticus]|uniref:Uncharacterized protein n=2 Tax=Candidatus Omnitrophus magneticus TaxID=1609969 RepID=A0A0F0CVZ3_9BACT|nr:hypothetical protein OMAG_000502 [Candidatus Omnitrophus magneticus]
MSMDSVYFFKKNYGMTKCSKSKNISPTLSFLRKQESIQVAEDCRKKIFWNLKLKINFRGWDVHGFRIFF